MRIANVILAAGASSRMGRLKQLLEWKGRSLIKHAISTSQGGDFETILVVLGANYEQIATHLKLEAVTVLQNKDWVSGLGTSIACAAHFLSDEAQNYDAMVVTLADQPFVTTSFLKQMYLKFKPKTSQIIATAYDKGKQGVPVLFDSVYFKALSKLKGDTGAKEFLKRYEALVEVVQPQFDNADIDTPEDYETLR